MFEIEDRIKGEDDFNRICSYLCITDLRKEFCDMAAIFMHHFVVSDQF